MFSENDTGNRCSDCTWADNAESKIATLEAELEPVRWISVQDRLPDSGVPVIVFVTGVYGDKTRRLRASYAARHTLTLGDDQEPWGEDCYDEKTDTYYCPEGWYEHNEHDETHWYIDGTVTHWMPLPEPPSGHESETTAPELWPADVVREVLQGFKSESESAEFGTFVIMGEIDLIISAIRARVEGGTE